MPRGLWSDLAWRAEELMQGLREMHVGKKKYHKLRKKRFLMKQSEEVLLMFKVYKY